MLLFSEPHLGSRVFLPSPHCSEPELSRPTWKLQRRRRCNIRIGRALTSGLAPALGTMLLTALSRQRRSEPRLSRLIFRPSFQALAVGDRAPISLSIMSRYAPVFMAAGTFKWRRIMSSGLRGTSVMLMRHQFSMEAHIQLTFFLALQSFLLELRRTTNSGSQRLGMVAYACAAVGSRLHRQCYI
jgi:hypothetical protein